MTYPNATHDAPPEAFAVAEPLRQPEPAQTRTAAEEARAIVASHSLGTLSTLTADGDPWGSLVTYGQLPDGSPVLLVSTLAEHGRNLRLDARASLVVAEAADGGDPLDSGRVTLAGRAEPPAEEEAGAARAAFLAAAESARHYIDFGDFSMYVLRVERVRWVGGFGRMDSVDAGAYAAAEPDPVAASAAYAVRHMNEDHADALLAMATGPAGFTDATAATCRRADRYGLDLWVTTPRGKGPARVGFAAPCTAPDGLRAATVELARRSRAMRPT
jgi:heme iron utilization protein